MKIRTRIGLLVTTLITLVVVSVAGNLYWLEQRRVRREFSTRVDALMEGVLRIGRESLSSDDELMLLSYLKFLMTDYRELELAVVGRAGHTSVLGAAGDDLLYRAITITETKAASFRPAASSPAAARAPSAELARTIPPATLEIKLGFSRAALRRSVRAAQAQALTKILGIAALGLLLGVLGSLWLAHLLGRPVAALAAAARRLEAGELDAVVEESGADELALLGRQFNKTAVALREAMRFKEDLMATLSHELNTPLGGLKGFLEYLQRPDAPKDAAEVASSYRTMEQAVRQMEISLTNALHLFRAGAGWVSKPERVDAVELARQAARLFEPTAQAGELTLREPAAREPAWLLADAELVRRIVVNLVSNAVKYTPPGGAVDVAVEEDEGAVRFVVRDTGPGIAPGDQEKIFTKFYRVADSGRARRIPGSGLGLAIVKQAAELLGGRVWLQSELGRGCVFTVSLPKAPRGKS